MKTFAIKIAASLAVIAALAYASAVVAPEPMEAADAAPAYAAAR